MQPREQFKHRVLCFPCPSLPCHNVWYASDIWLKYRTCCTWTKIFLELLYGFE